MIVVFFFFNDTATTEIYTLSLHDALPISEEAESAEVEPDALEPAPEELEEVEAEVEEVPVPPRAALVRSEEHTSELQSRQYLVCRLLLEKKKKKIHLYIHKKSAKELKLVL